MRGRNYGLCSDFCDVCLRKRVIRIPTSEFVFYFAVLNVLCLHERQFLNRLLISAHRLRQKITRISPLSVTFEVR